MERSGTARKHEEGRMHQEKKEAVGRLGTKGVCSCLDPGSILDVARTRREDHL